MYDDEDHRPRSPDRRGYRRSPARRRVESEYYHSRKGHSRSPPSRRGYDDSRGPSTDSPRGSISPRSPASHGDYRDIDSRRRRDAGYSRRRDSLSPPRNHRSGYRNDRDEWDDYDRDWDGRRHHARNRSPSRQSSTLILEGLPTDVTEDDILDGFASVSDFSIFRVDDVKGVRLRNNKKGRRIGFVEFYRVADASAFLDYHYPAVTIELAHSRGMGSEPVTIDLNFSRGRDEDGRGDGRPDDRDFVSGRGGPRAFSGPRLTGETDECPHQNPSQYLVVRGLGHSTTEEILAQGLGKLFVESKSDPPPRKDTPMKLKSTAPTANIAALGARPDSLRRVFVARDRRTNESLGYGFAEYKTLEDAQSAITKFRTTPKFSISSKPVQIAFIHTGVFVPYTGRTSDEDRFGFRPIYNPDILVQYWDDRAYLNPLNISLESENTGQASVDQREQERERERKRKRAAAAASGSSSGNNAMNAVPMGSQMQKWAQKRAELKEGLPKDDPDESRAGHGRDGDEKVDDTTLASRSQYVSYSDWEKLECLLCALSFKTEAGLKEHETHNEEHIQRATDEHLQEEAVTKLHANRREPRNVLIRMPRDPYAPGLTYTSYADIAALECQLCKRKFTSEKALRIHELESALHLDNLRLSDNVDRATAELAKKGIAPVLRKAKPKADDSKQYRDRAKERRITLGPSQAGWKAGKSQPKPKPKAQAAAAAAPSKGAAMLSKMGWAAGKGLGAEGGGRTEAVTATQYAAGVGLGAEGGKQEQHPEGDFVEETRRRARARFAGLDQ